MLFMVLLIFNADSCRFAFLTRSHSKLQYRFWIDSQPISKQKKNLHSGYIKTCKNRPSYHIASHPITCTLCLNRYALHKHTIFTVSYGKCEPNSIGICMCDSHILFYILKSILCNGTYRLLPSQILLVENEQQQQQ